MGAEGNVTIDPRDDQEASLPEGGGQGRVKWEEKGFRTEASKKQAFVELSN